MHIFKDRLYFERSGEGKNLLFLHGWGTSGSTFKNIINKIEGYTVYTVDFPGFGASKEPEKPWTVSDYTALIKNFIIENKLSPITIIAHSFGARVAIKLASESDLVDKLFLTGAAGIKPKRTSQYYIKVYSFKLLRFIRKIPILGLLFSRTFDATRKLSGSSDYNAASDVLKATLSKVVNEDLTHLLSRISCPTMLLFGEKDDATPLSNGIIMNKLIPNSSLIVFKNTGHFAYIEREKEFSLILSAFLSEKLKGSKASTDNTANLDEEKGYIYV